MFPSFDIIEDLCIFLAQMRQTKIYLSTYLAKKKVFLEFRYQGIREEKIPIYEWIFERPTDLLQLSYWNQ